MAQTKNEIDSSTSKNMKGALDVIKPITSCLPSQPLLLSSAWHQHDACSSAQDGVCHMP